MINEVMPMKMTKGFYQQRKKEFHDHLGIIKKEVQFYLLNSMKNAICQDKDNKNRRIHALSYFFLKRIDRTVKLLKEIESEISGEILSAAIEGHECEDLGGGPFSCSFCQNLLDILRNKALSQEAQYLLLSVALYHQDRIVRDDAKNILRNSMTKQTALKLIDLIERGENPYSAMCILCGYVDEEIKYPELCIDTIIKISLDCESDSLREHAASTMDQHHPHSSEIEERIVKRLTDALRYERDPIIRNNAAWALIYHPMHSASIALIHALDDENALVRRSAIYALGFYGAIGMKSNVETEASQKLLELFKDKYSGIRSNAIKAFWQIRINPTKRELYELLNMLIDPDPAVRLETYEAIAEIKKRDSPMALNEPEFFSLLQERISKETDSQVLGYSIWVQTLLNKPSSNVFTESGLEDYCIELLSQDEDSRKNAINILRRIGTKKSLFILKELHKDYRKAEDYPGLFYAIKDIKERIGNKNLIS